jgi:hypothetical protein
MFLDANHNTLQFEIDPDIVKPTPKKTFVLKKKNDISGEMEVLNDDTTETINNSVTKTLNATNDPDNDLIPEFGVYQFEVTSKLNCFKNLVANLRFTLLSSTNKALNPVKSNGASSLEPTLSINTLPIFISSTTS